MKSDKRPLWAPWRIEFIRSKKTAGCFLCGKKKISDTPEEKLIVYRGKTMFVILNRYPYNSGHLMVVPYRHIGDISKMTSAERLEMMDVCIKAKAALSKTMKPEGFNIGFNLGLPAGAGVADHIHMHIVPRWTGDTNFMPVLSDTRVVPEVLEDTADIIRKHMK